MRQNIDSMQKEFTFWVSNRMINVTVGDAAYQLAHYDVEVDGPRPGKLLTSLYYIFLFLGWFRGHATYTFY